VPARAGVAMLLAAARNGGRGNGQRRDGGGGDKGLVKHWKRPPDCKSITEMVDGVKRKGRASQRPWRDPVVNGGFVLTGV